MVSNSRSSSNRRSEQVLTAPGGGGGDTLLNCLARKRQAATVIVGKRKSISGLRDHGLFRAIALGGHADRTIGQLLPSESSTH